MTNYGEQGPGTAGATRQEVEEDDYSLSEPLQKVLGYFEELGLGEHFDIQKSAEEDMIYVEGEEGNVALGMYFGDILFREYQWDKSGFPRDKDRYDNPEEATSAVLEELGFDIPDFLEE